VDPSAARRVALMAIHPRYADAILDGRKQVEFRKRPLAADVRIVVIYATAPVSKIVGEFTVGETLFASPRKLWSSVGRIGCIDRASYDAYYAGVRRAVGIVAASPWRYESPLALCDLEVSPCIPQSFVYLPAHALEELRAWQAESVSVYHSA
jgi:predicted transcriptional regulator